MAQHIEGVKRMKIVLAMRIMFRVYTLLKSATPDIDKLIDDIETLIKKALNK